MNQSDTFPDFKPVIEPADLELIRRFAQSQPKEFLVMKSVMMQAIEHYKNVMNLRRDIGIGVAAASAQHSTWVLSKIFEALFVMDAIPEPPKPKDMSQWR